MAKRFSKKYGPTVGGRKGSGVRAYNVSCCWNAINSAYLRNWYKLSTFAKNKMAFCFCCGKSVLEGEEKKRRRLLSNQNLQVCL